MAYDINRNMILTRSISFQVIYGIDERQSGHDRLGTFLTDCFLPVVFQNDVETTLLNWYRFCLSAHIHLSSTI